MRHKSCCAKPKQEKLCETHCVLFDPIQKSAAVAETRPIRGAELSLVRRSGRIHPVVVACDILISKVFNHYIKNLSRIERWKSKKATDFSHSSCALQIDRVCQLGEN